MSDPHRLGCILITDPLLNTAQAIAGQCERLAQRQEIATTGQHAREQIEKHRPDLALLSAELTHPQILELVTTVREHAPETFVVISYRELSVPLMQKLQGQGVHTFLEQPVDTTELYRAAAKHFAQPFRRHDRFKVTLEMYRADGVLIGRTIDLSEGGLRMEALHPLSANDSLLVDIPLKDNDIPVRVRCNVLSVDGDAPMKVHARIQFQNLRGHEYKQLLDFLDDLRPTHESTPSDTKPSS